MGTDKILTEDKRDILMYMDIDTLVQDQQNYMRLLFWKDQLLEHGDKESTMKPNPDYPSQEYLAYRKSLRDALGDYLTDDDINKIIDETVIKPTIHTTAEYVEELLASCNTNPGKLSKLSGLDSSIFNKVRQETRTLPKTSAIALCLILQMDADEVQTTFHKTGHKLGDELYETIFKQFIENRKYALGDYVEAVRNAAAKVEQDTGISVPLDHFFEKEYTNVTLRRIW